jgi:hypothetical protein
VDYPTGNRPTAVVLGDLSGDGELDLAVTNDKSVSVLLGKGDGTFADKVDYPTGDQPTAVALGDLNGDGQPDMVTSNSGVRPSSASIPTSPSPATTSRRRFVY